MHMRLATARPNRFLRFINHPGHWPLASHALSHSALSTQYSAAQRSGLGTQHSPLADSGTIPRKRAHTQTIFPSPVRHLTSHTFFRCLPSAFSSSSPSSSPWKVYRSKNWSGFDHTSSLSASQKASASARPAGWSTSAESSPGSKQEASCPSTHKKARRKVAAIIADCLAPRGRFRLDPMPPGSASPALGGSSFHST
eukprot:scaffold10505_cov102-Isochrysis_galbana.AAC.5